MAIATIHGTFVFARRVCVQRNWIFEVSRFNAMDREVTDSTIGGTDHVLRADVLRALRVQDPDAHGRRLTRILREHALEYGTNCLRHVTVAGWRGMKLVRRVAEQIG